VTFQLKSVPPLANDFTSYKESTVSPVGGLVLPLYDTIQNAQYKVHCMVNYIPVINLLFIYLLHFVYSIFCRLNYWPQCHAVCIWLRPNQISEFKLKTERIQWRSILSRFRKLYVEMTLAPSSGQQVSMSTLTHSLSITWPDVCLSRDNKARRHPAAAAAAAAAVLAQMRWRNDDWWWICIRMMISLMTHETKRETTGLAFSRASSVLLLPFVPSLYLYRGSVAKRQEFPRLFT